MYNLTNITAANDLYNIVKSTNDMSGQLFMTMAMMLLFFSFLAVFHKKDIKKVLLADSFLMVIVGAMAWSLEFVGWTFVIVPIVLFLVMLISYKFLDT